MAVENTQICISMPAGEDLSGHQFRFMTVNASGQVVHANAADAKLGVLQNKPSAAGRGAEVCIGGTSKLIASGAINENAYLTSDGDGKAAATTTDNAQVGALALTPAGADGDTIFAMVTGPQRY